MKARAVSRFSLLSTLLFAGWSVCAKAVPIGPIEALCQNALGIYVKCPPPPKPATGATARRAYLRSFADDLRGKQVVRLKGGAFQILTPAQWYPSSEEAVQGWCVARVDEQPEQRTRFYHAWLDRESCLASRGEVTRPEPFDPFKAYAKERIICDSEDSAKCSQAAKRFAALAATDLENDQNIIFEYPTLIPVLRQRFAGHWKINLAREGSTILVDRGPCIGISPGGMLCGNVFHALTTSQYTFVSDSRSLPSGAWRFRVMENLQLRGCHVDDGRPQTLTLFIENDSDELLECQATLNTSERSPGMAGPLFIEPRERRVALESCFGGRFSSADVTCAPRAPVSPVKWDLPAGCSYSILRSTPIEWVYPKGSMRRGEEGTVNVSFKVSARGYPVDAEIASGSDLKPLQEAALRHVRWLKVSATCPYARYLTQVHFRLGDSGVPREFP